MRDDLIDVPGVIETRMILALMRAAALGARERRHRDGLRDQQHVAQVVSGVASFALLDHDPIRLNRIMISSLCLSMIFSENRFPLFRIML